MPGVGPAPCEPQFVFGISPLGRCLCISQQGVVLGGLRLAFGAPRWASCSGASHLGDTFGVWHLGAGIWRLALGILHFASRVLHFAVGHWEGPPMPGPHFERELAGETLARLPNIWGGGALGFYPPPRLRC